jgi:hypothetical protein
MELAVRTHTAPGAMIPELRRRIRQVNPNLAVGDFPWRELIVDAPMGTEFCETCHRVTPHINERHRKMQLKYTQAILGTKEVSEVFMLAVDGLTQDLPSPKVVRRRLEVLLDRFVRN